jgi:contractile injection system tube protein
MGDVVKVRKAKLIELDARFKKAAPNGRQIEVQFNPDSLKVTFANRTQEQKSSGDQRGNSTRQVVGAGSTKLALQLWFDVSAPGAGGVRDVRALTQRVAYFMLPKAAPGARDRDQPVPPGVRFEWGTFWFDGLMDSLDETLDYFSPDGKPLRANLNIGLSGQIEIVPPDGGGKAAAGPTPGTRPLVQATGGAPLQALTDRGGAGGDWQAVAAANGIENPRLLAAGQLLDLRGGAGL